MEFGLLGPLTVRCGETVLRVPQGRQRTLLAVLLLQANQVVAVDEIAETLWGAGPPPSAAVTIRNYVRRLRQALGTAGPDRISFRWHGYVLSAGDQELDVARFGQLLGSARAAARVGCWDEAAGAAAEALGLWRGEALADIESEVLVLAERPRLAELRLQATEVKVEAELRLGRHAEVLAELTGLAADHPLREHLHALLMLALYRCGRQGEALTAYQQARTVLTGELGVEPGSELRELQQQILTADPALNLPQQPAMASGTSNSAPAGQVLHVPRQLPPAVADFTGRAGELAALTEILDHTNAGSPGTVVISAIGGMAGVGKTALAVHWAHLVAGRFGDGQLYVNLRGFDPTGTPATPAEVTRAILDALGVPPERIPPGPETQAGLYRSLLADRKMLIVLDNCRDEQQLRPLLPASPGSLVLVTSRNQLTGLAAADRARLLNLDVLTREEAVQMLTARLGASRAGAELDAVSEIAALCARLPLALAVASSRAQARPAFPLAAVAAELRDAADRLEALDTGDPSASVRAAFSWSYRQLSPRAARMFRLLGLHPGPDITLPAAASLAGIPLAQARQDLGELARAHLIGEQVPGRYAFHDLLRAHAAEQARATDSDTDRHAALGRALDHYLHTGHRAAVLINPALDPITIGPPRPAVTQESLTSYQQAITWLTAEHRVMQAAVTLAAASGFDSHVWQVTWVMAEPMYRQGLWHEQIVIEGTAVAAAARLGDTAGQAESLRHLGRACQALGDDRQAVAHYGASAAFYQQLGDRIGEARVSAFLAHTQGRYADALSHLELALHLYKVAGHRPAEAAVLNNIGWNHAQMGNYQQARPFFQQSLALGAELGLRAIEPLVWHSLGYAEHHIGNFAEAAACYQHALGIFRELGFRYHEAGTLADLGESCHAAGQLQQAHDAWRQALPILDELHHPDADHVRAKLASISSLRDEESLTTGHKRAYLQARPLGSEELSAAEAVRRSG